MKGCTKSRCRSPVLGELGLFGLFVTLLLLSPGTVPAKHVDPQGISGGKFSRQARDALGLASTSSGELTGRRSNPWHALMTLTSDPESHLLTPRRDLDLFTPETTLAGSEAYTFDSKR